ncbi:YbhB/YbcL family Raf kinase inhibitor-like protein [Euzebya sp.]|uniref:YbhB/YbcL family Raf kinase inhibitor-like protein n=1 Tax=Euzebya sp. TaxID=1971409 RepID=UPI0035197E48
MAAFRLTSPAFDHDDDLPVRFTQDGDDVSPPLTWEGVPEGTKELVLICEDRDGDEGVVTHWVVYGILPDETDGLPEDLGDQALVSHEGFELYQGLNEFDNSGWTGPTSAEDRGPHRYFFRLFAMDAELVELSPGATRHELRKAAEGHVLATAEIVGIA